MRKYWRIVSKIRGKPPKSLDARIENKGFIDLHHRVYPEFLRRYVLAYYQRGAYHQALGEARSLKPVVLEYSSVFQKFYGQGAMSGDFQDSDRIRAKAQMIRALLAAVTGEHHA